MKALRFSLIVFLFSIIFILRAKSQELVKDSIGNYYLKTQIFKSKVILKPIDSTSCRFYQIKKDKAYRHFQDTFSFKKNNLFLNLGFYAYYTFLSKENFISNDEFLHRNLNIQISLEYFFV